MTRAEKIQMLEDITMGKLDVKKMVHETVHFILPCNDGSGNFMIITRYGSRTVTKKQIEALNIGI